MSFYTDKYTNTEADSIISTSNVLSMYDWYSLKSSLWSCVFFAVLESSDTERDECLENLCRLTGCEDMSQVRLMTWVIRNHCGKV